MCTHTRYSEAKCPLARALKVVTVDAVRLWSSGPCRSLKRLGSEIISISPITEYKMPASLKNNVDLQY